MLQLCVPEKKITSSPKCRLQLSDFYFKIIITITMVTIKVTMREITKQWYTLWYI